LDFCSELVSSRQFLVAKFVSVLRPAENLFLAANSQMRGTKTAFFEIQSQSPPCEGSLTIAFRLWMMATAINPDNYAHSPDIDHIVSNQTALKFFFKIV